jgi:hypothetical protein
MKTQNRFRQSASALMALSALLILTPTASAITFVWVDGPQAGQAFTGGGIQVKAINYDTGSLYNPTVPFALNSAIGFGQGGASADVASGIAALNAAQTRAAIGSVANQNDSWGILKITSIQATASDGVLHDIYNSAVAPVELTAMFWGVNDFYLKQVSAGVPGFAGNGQIIDGQNLRVDIYSDPSKDFNQTGGPTLGHTVNTYPTATNGVLELSLLSTPGFINAAGTLGGVATEFESNTASVGYAALNVIGGASAAQFNTNAIGFGGSSGAQFAPGLGNQTSTDVWFSFTSTQGSNGWDITSNDPMLANITPGVPDSGSALLMFAMGLAGLGFGCRRFSRKV